ncbi:hypothetical protein N7520_005491 [Penicillium odoratum]|uniref:uncharacterized protein n=1 Tax=Penicillium odoratum TaxID=1167516 RepID=UPI002548348A|nr:uncharacterized protein N7520_005491 [Penicillium odoratum]KAJ5765932.1 hypothetical protein N7520_005491 [Penicillium odoratum]
MVILYIWTSILANLLCGQTVQALATGENNYSCKSSSHPNPVILIHGLFCNADYMDAIAVYLQSQDFCTYATTYGAYAELPLIGGLMPINESAVVLADFISAVKTKTGASKVDLVGHSEGALMTLYIPKFENVTSLVDKVVAVAPPSYGTTISGITNLIQAFGSGITTEVEQVIDEFGCDACTDVLPDGTAISLLDSGPIAQPGIEYHIIASRKDEVVTPVWNAFVNETGVTNLYIQDRCPYDVTGHLAEPFDTNVIQQIAYYLDPNIVPSTICDLGGLPLRSR